MKTLHFLYEKEFKINDFIKVMIPSVGEVVADEDNYYNLVASLTAMPVDVMAQLDEAGIDFASINAYDLFLMTFSSLATMDTHLIFGDLDLSKFELTINKENETIILRDPQSGAVIDRSIHNKIAEVLRKIHHLEKNRRKPGNQEAKEYMLERAKIKAKRNKNRATESQLEPLIIAMVNTEQFKYDFDSVRNISIYQFNESVRQVIKKVDYEHKMNGVYAGTVSVKNLGKDDLNWLTHK